MLDLQTTLTFTNNPWPTVKHIEDVMLFKRAENNSDLIKFFTFCNGLSVPKTVNSSIDQNYTWSEVTNLSKCNDVFGELRTNLSSLIVRDLKRMKYKSMELEYQKYYTFVDNIPLTATLNTSVYHGRQKCLSYEDEIIYLDNLLNDIIKLAANISETNSFSEVYKYAMQIVKLFEERRQYSATKILTMYSDVRTFCRNTYYTIKNTLDELDGPLEYFHDIRLHLRNSVIGQYSDIKDNYHLLYVRFFRDIIPTVMKAESYLDKNRSTTKNDLAKRFNSHVFLMDVNDLNYLARDLEEMINNYIQQMQISLNQVNIIYRKIFSFDFPVLSSYNIYNLPFVKAAASIDDSEIQHLVQSMKDNVNYNLMELWDMSYHKLITGVEDIKEDVIRPVEDLVRKVTEFSQALKDFQESLKIDTDFFM